MKDKLIQLKKEFDKEIKNIKNNDDIEALKNKYLGRKKGALSLLMKDLKNVSKDKIADLGKLANITKQEISSKINTAHHSLSSNDGIDQVFDPTIIPKKRKRGHLHPVTLAIREISDIFQRIGFQRKRYPEVEWDYYAFEALNMPPEHPARDDWETFFIDKEPISKKYGQRLLTPHTSSGQIREMEKNKLPIRMMNISKTYRRQIDASHTPMFHQFEGLLIDKNINITHLKGVFDYFVKKYYGFERETRLRPHHFQFTEPSFELDVSCGVCGGSGKTKHGKCKLCKEGWLELAGAGMVHPNVLEAGGLDKNKYSGFAFGWGVERCYTMKGNLNMDDIRLLYKNDLTVIDQF